MTISKRGTILSTLAQWKELAPPKADYQWVDGRSAKEVARVWLAGGGSTMPPEVLNVLERHDRFGAVLAWEAEPEARLPFDGLAGEPRNSDLVVHARDSFGPYVLAIEAKADEPFDETLGKTLAAAAKRRLLNPRSRGEQRVEQLLQGLLGKSSVDAQSQTLRYQLLTACAGALSEAERRGCQRTVMLVQEFVTDHTKDSLHERNAADLHHFLTAVESASEGALVPVRGEHLSGPFVLPGTPLVSARIELFIGKVTHHLRGRSPLAD